MADPQKELETFAYVASHDMREPLRKIQSFGAILAENLQGRLDEESSYCLESMISGANRLSEMLDGLLLYSRASRCVLDPEGCFLGSVMVDLLDDWKKRDPEATFQVHPLPWAPISVTHAHTLLDSLLDNAVKFKHPQRPLTVNIGYSLEDNAVYLQDNGIGIPADQVELALSLFGRLHGRSEQYPGHGLGLAICQKMVQNVKGHLSIQPATPEGTRVVIQIPGFSMIGVS